MITAADFGELLKRSEGPTLDFKGIAYDLTSDDSKVDLIKDVICMANTPRAEASFLVLGVRKLPNGDVNLIGLNKHIDDADLQSQFDDRVHPIPVLSYVPIQYQGKSYAVIEIPPERRGPCMLARDSFGNKLQRGKIYFRHGSKNKVATLPDEISAITLWCTGHSAPRQLDANEGLEWRELWEAVNGFDSTRCFLLLSSQIDGASSKNNDALGTVPWSAVIDFDPQSETGGLFKWSAATLQERNGLHKIVPGERAELSIGRSTYWYFARGAALPGQDAQPVPFRGWIKESAGFLNDFVRKLGGILRPRPVTILVVWYGDTQLDFLNSCLDTMLSSFGTSAEIVIATNDQARLDSSADRVGAKLVTIPLDQLCGGMAATMQALPGGLVTPTLPSSSGAPVPLGLKDVAWLEEELELVHRYIGTIAPVNRNIGRDFLKGAEITWYELGLHYDIDRDLAGPLESQLRADLKSRQTVRVNLYHFPGAGGTTLSKRTLWNFRDNYPCVRLLRIRPRETIERLKFLTNSTGLPILVVLDGSEVSQRDADDLFELTRAYHIPAVFLQIFRRLDPTTGKRSFFLPALLTSAEANRFAHVFAKEEPSRAAELKRLEGLNNASLRNAFYFGLVAFEREFAGLDRYIRQRLANATTEQNRVLLYLAFSHHFGQSSLAAQAFAGILGAPKNIPLDLRKYLSPELLSLILEGTVGHWRTIHNLVALEIIEQVLSSGASDKKVWRYVLADRAREFARFLRGSDSDPSEALLEVTRRVFLYRDNIELLGKETSATGAFSRLIESIPVPESGAEVLSTLTELYPEDSHFWAHLGRYFNVRLKNQGEALRCIDRAIALNDEDYVLFHMKGMVLRAGAYALMDNNAELAKVIEAAQASSEVFQRTRALNSDAEHGFISEVQLLIKLLDYAAKKQNASTIEVLRLPSASPYLRETVDLIETLLDGVRRIRPADEPSFYETNCRARLDELYGDYQVALQAWDSLLARPDIYKPTIRRQIVWTHLARRQRSWDSLQPKEVERINALLEENLLEERFDDRNFRLWLQAAKRRKAPPSLDSIIERVAQWKANSSSLDATYYLYVCYALAAIDGSLSARESCGRFLDECRQRARYRADRSKSFEWLGPGQGISRLVHHSALGDWDRDVGFWSRRERLVRVNGRIARIEGPQAGEVATEGALSAFFVPGVGSFVRGRSENELVNFYLGFSYDGVRAWDVLPLRG